MVGRRYYRAQLQQGFTLVELLLVMGLMAILLGMTTVVFVRPQTNSASVTAVDRLVADLKAQQLRAMAGDSDSATSAQPYGIYVQPSQYTLFKGSTYSAADTDNFVVAAGDNITFSTTFGSSTVLFTKGSGDITSFVNGSNTITATNSISTQARIITLNRYGAATVN